MCSERKMKVELCMCRERYSEVECVVRKRRRWSVYMERWSVYV